MDAKEWEAMTVSPLSPTMMLLSRLKGSGINYRISETNAFAYQSIAQRHSFPRPVLPGPPMNPDASSDFNQGIGSTGGFLIDGHVVDWRASGVRPS